MYKSETTVHFDLTYSTVEQDVMFSVVLIVLIVLIVCNP